MPDTLRATSGTQRYTVTTTDRAAIIEEVESGLRNARDRIAQAAENQAYLDLDYGGYEAKSGVSKSFDDVGDCSRQSGFASQAVTRLCQHTYNPGPQRKVADNAAADTLLQEVYEQTRIDAVMHEAEVLSTLNDVCAIQVTCTNDPAQPVDLQLWGAEEFEVFLDPIDQRKARAVVTIDRIDEQTRYRLWFPDECYTFMTLKSGTSNGKASVVAYQQGPPEENTYGVLPFAFVHFQPPVRRFWTPAPGTFLVEAEENINAQISKAAESITKFSDPIGIFKNVSVEFNPEIGPGRFLRLTRGTAGYTGDGYAESGDPSAEYLQATLAVEQVWHDVQQYMAQVAEAADLPPTALRLDYSDAPSGISIIIRSAPLLTRARQRRPIYQWAESDLAKLVLTCVGTHYPGMAGLAEYAPNCRLLLSWPEPRIPIPGPERDTADEWEIGLGIKSRVNVAEERYGLTHDQAIDRIKQVAEDETQARELMPEPEPPPGSEVGPDGKPIPQDESKTKEQS